MSSSRAKGLNKIQFMKCKCHCYDTLETAVPGMPYRLRKWMIAYTVHMASVYLQTTTVFQIFLEGVGGWVDTS